MKIGNKVDNNSKHLHRKIDFSFDSSHCASSIKMRVKLRGDGGMGGRVEWGGGWGVLHILSWEKPKKFEKKSFEKKVLDSSETHLEVVTIKIRAKLNNSSKITKCQRIKILFNEKIGNFFLHTFQNIGHLLMPKTQYGYFLRKKGEGVEGARGCMLFSKKYASHSSVQF